MSDTDAMWVETAKGLGPLAAGQYRVVVLESDLSVTKFDTESLDKAKAYAADAVSEAETANSPLAWVFNDRFEIVYRGKHYADSR